MCFQRRFQTFNVRSDLIWNSELFHRVVQSHFLPQVVYLLLDFAVHTTAEYVSATEGVASKTLFVPSLVELHCWYV